VGDERANVESGGGWQKRWEERGQTKGLLLPAAAAARHRRGGGAGAQGEEAAAARCALRA
jgi:hypothetical protein